MRSVGNLILCATRASQGADMQKFISDKQLAERYEVSRATVWRWSSSGRLPQPVHLSPGCTRWRVAEIEQRETELQSTQAA